MSPDSGPVRVLGINGSLRSRSVNAAVLNTARAVAPDGVVVEIADIVGSLPWFSLDLDVEPLPEAVTASAAAIASADAVLFCIPEYAGGMPGAFKNFLDWTVGGSGGVLHGKPVAWLAAGEALGRGALAHEALRTTLGYIGANIVENACRGLAVTSGDIGEDLLVADALTSAEIAAALEALRGSLQP